MADHHIDDRQPHRVWDNALPPRAHVQPNDTVVFETIEALGRITPESPVFVPGALFSCGDCHAAQGDGEVNGTGIEAPMTVTLRFNVIKGANIPEPRFTTPPGKNLTVADAGGYFVTTAHGPDLYQNAQQAIRYMI